MKPPPKPPLALLIMGPGWGWLPGGGHGTSCMRAGTAADDDVRVELATEASCARRSMRRTADWRQQKTAGLAVPMRWS
jgi:hypothetical protein